MGIFIWKEEKKNIISFQETRWLSLTGEKTLINSYVISTPDKLDCLNLTSEAPARQ